MRTGTTSFFALAVGFVVALTTAVSPALTHADERAAGGASSPFALDLSGTRYGFVRASLLAEGEKNAAAEPRLVIDAQEVSPALVALVDGFVQGKPLKRDVRLTSGAVVRKARDARLVSIKLPALGSGGSADLELVLAVPALTTQPLLSAKEAPPAPPSGRITTFRVDFSGMAAVDAPKLDAITVTQRDGASVTTGEIGLEVAAGGAPPFVAWQKASSAKPSPRTLRVEYVGADGAAILKLQLDRCTPTSVKALGASGTTRITVTCGGLRSGGA